MLALVMAGSLFGGVPDLPDLPQLPEIRRTPQITYVDRSGAVLGVRGGKAAPPVDLARLPAYVPAAFVAIEDKRFYEHGGFDAIGIARALMTDIAKGRTAQGASTITQQTVRNLFLSQDQTMERKTEELLLSVQMERKFTKQQILSLYLSRVYFGAGAYGIEAASRRFFNKPAARLSIREAAALAAVMKSPAGYSPVEQPERSAERTRLVLDAMVETGAITPAQRAKALATPLKVYKTDPEAPAQYFVDWADQQVRQTIGAAKQDLVVETTLDAPMETAAGAAARSIASKVDRGEAQTALVALDGGGRVRAMIGGVDYAQSQYNRAVLAHRQAGSAWKPFVYLTALEAGRTPDTVVVDEPVTINGWSPRNHTDSYLGQITLARALAESVNTVAARTADEVGRDNVLRTARRLGIVSEINTDPAMALGTSQVTPLEMATAYDAFANGGRRVEAYGVERIRTASGQVLWRHPVQAYPQAINNPPLSEIDDMLRGVIANGTARRAAIPGRDLAGKTGTTSDSRDAWFCGFTGDLTAVVWMGRDDSRPMGEVAGGGPPTAVWRAFMVSAMPRAGATPIPPGPPPPPPQPLLQTAAAPAGEPGQPAPVPAAAPIQPPL